MIKTNKSDPSFKRKKLIEEALDSFGTNLLLTLINFVEAIRLMRTCCLMIFLFTPKKFSEDKLLHYGYYRFKIYQLFIDAWRKEKSRLDKATENIPEKPKFKHTEAGTNYDDAKLKQSFFEEHPVNLSARDKDLLWMWARLGLTYLEISKKTGMPKSTVADRINYARTVIVEYVNSQAYNR